MFAFESLSQTKDFLEFYRFRRRNIIGEGFLCELHYMRLALIEVLLHFALQYLQQFAVGDGAFFA